MPLFRSRTRASSTARTAPEPRPEALPYVRDAKTLGFIYARARNRYREGMPLLGKAIGGKIRRLIDEHIVSLGVDPKIPPISITAAKFAPAALVPLLATGTGEEPKRTAWPQFALAFAGVVALAVFMYLPSGGLREFYDTTLGFQLGRTSPFSAWGLEPSLEPLQEVLKLAAIALAAALAFVPRRRDLRQVAALAGAVTIAVQLPATHWFYFYLVWIAPLALVACMGAYATAPVAARAGQMD
jgi:hypothetical protein